LDFPLYVLSHFFVQGSCAGAGGEAQNKQKNKTDYLLGKNWKMPQSCIPLNPPCLTLEISYYSYKEKKHYR
jgi:hypothetical protein